MKNLLSGILIALFLIPTAVSAQPPWPLDPETSTLLSPCIGIASCSVVDDPSTPQDVLAMMDMRDLTLTEERNINNELTRYFYHPSWDIDSIGNIFGLAIDSERNFYATASSNYPNKSFVTNFITRYGDIGGGANDIKAAGTIYKFDKTTGQASVFAQLPQQEFDFFQINCEDGIIGSQRTTGVGLGNIVFDNASNQFYVSNFEDGKIYRLGMDGSIIDSFDPLTPDDNTPGWPIGTDLPFGLAIHPTNRILYFGTYGVPENQGTQENAQIYKVDIATDGSLVAGSEQSIFTVPDINQITSPPVRPLHVAISDLDFSPKGDLLLIGGRSTCSYATGYNHWGTLWTADVSEDGNSLTVSEPIPTSSNTNSFTGEMNRDGYGGVSFCAVNDSLAYIVTSSSDLNTELGPHGILAFSVDYQVASSATSIFPYVFPSSSMPYDPISPYVDNKGIGGDVEVFNEPVTTTVIPTVSFWGMMILGLLIASIGVVYIMPRSVSYA